MFKKTIIKQGRNIVSSLLIILLVFAACNQNTDQSKSGQTEEKKITFHLTKKEEKLIDSLKKEIQVILKDSALAKQAPMHPANPLNPNDKNGMDHIQTMIDISNKYGEQVTDLPEKFYYPRYKSKSSKKIITDSIIVSNPKDKIFIRSIIYSRNHYENRKEYMFKMTIEEELKEKKEFREFHKKVSLPFEKSRKLMLEKGDMSSIAYAYEMLYWDLVEHSDIPYNNYIKAIMVLENSLLKNPKIMKNDEFNLNILLESSYPISRYDRWFRYITHPKFNRTLHLSKHKKKKKE